MCAPLIQNTLVKQTLDYDHTFDFHNSVNASILESWQIIFCNAKKKHLSLYDLKNVLTRFWFLLFFILYYNKNLETTVLPIES